MGIFELIVLSVCLAMDAFAVSICLGLNMERATHKKALVVGLYFGIFQAAMPLIGYFIASLIADQINAFAHWIAFALLAVLGIKMIIQSFKEKHQKTKTSLHPRVMLPFAIATSIDALAVGVSFAFLHVAVAPAVALIGAVTLVASIIGVKLGEKIGLRFQSKAELLGGIVLILIGIKIVLDGYGLI